jgi:phosphopantetheine binding protein
MKVNSEVEAAGSGQVSDQALQAGNQEPHSPDEKYLASLWVEIIGLDPGQLLLTHKFIEVGGNSLTLNIILNRIEVDTGASLAAELFFFDDERSSLCALARELEALRAGKRAQSQ